VDINTEILVIKSDEKELVKFESFLFNYFEKKKLPAIYFNKVLLCISEAIINAIYHGNKNDFSKTVTIRILYDNGAIYADIIDEGTGFDFNCITDPTKGEYIRKESGRGLHIIKSLCECLDFKEKGKCVSIKIGIK
jgi:serine/threonine-protein kinase RsbW